MEREKEKKSNMMQKEKMKVNKLVEEMSRVNEGKE